MNVVILSGIYPPDIGGPATHASDLAAELRGRGHGVTVLTLRDARSGAAGVVSFPRAWPWPLRSLAILSWLVARRRRYDVVFATSLPMLAALGTRLARRPLVLKTVGDPAWERSRRRGLITQEFDDFQRQPAGGLRVRIMLATRNWAVRRAEALVTPSDYLRTVVEGWSGRQDVAVVANGVRVPAMASAPADQPGPLRAVVVGRLVDHKRVNLLIDAIAEVDDVVLEVVGDGPERLALEDQARRLDVVDRVTFAGSLSHVATLEHVAASHVLLSASSYEGLPHAHLEALVLGVPVVTVKSGGSEEAVIDGVNAVLLDEATPAAFARELGALHADRPRLAGLAQGAAANAAGWRFERTADEMEALLRSVTRRPPLAVYVGRARFGSLRSPDAAAKLAIHRRHLRTVWVTPGNDPPERAVGGSTAAIKLPRVPALGPAFFYAWAPAVAVRRAAREPGAVVVCQSPFEGLGAVIYARLVPRRLRPRVQIELHGDWRTASRLYGGPLRRRIAPMADSIAVWALRRADRVRAVSQLLASEAVAAGCTCPIDVHITFSNYGTFLEPPPAKMPAEPVALFVGVLERYKAVDVLLQSWPDVVARVPSARLRIVGAGREDAALRATVAEAGLEHSVEFLAPVPRDELRKLMDDSWCLVLPSRSEGLARIVVEAMARSRAVVASDVGGIREVLEDGRNGRIVPADDPEALADALTEVLEDSDRAAKLGAEARQRAVDRNPLTEYDAGIGRLAEWIQSS